MGNTMVLAEFLSHHGFRRHTLVRNQIGHLQLVGLLQNATVDILVDTGAASTVLDLLYCRAKAFRHAKLASSEEEPGASRWRYMLWTARHYRWMVMLFAVMAFTRSILST